MTTYHSKINQELIEIIKKNIEELDDDYKNYRVDPLTYRIQRDRLSRYWGVIASDEELGENKLKIMF